MICTCAPELRPFSAEKLLVISLNSWTASRLNVPVPDEPVVEISDEIALSTVMLLARPRDPLELKLPDPRNGLSLLTGTTPGDKVANCTGSRPWFGSAATVWASRD